VDAKWMLAIKMQTDWIYPI